MKKYRTVSAAMIALMAAGAATGGMIASQAAYASEQNDVKSDTVEFSKLGNAKIDLAKAVAAAENAFGGKAVNAALDSEQVQPSFEVELMTANGSKTVAVDGQSGKVSVVADAHDSGEASDAE